MPVGYKPSPLGYGSPRSSPFRRPESPTSPSLAHRQITPTPSPTKPGSLFMPSRLANPTTPTSTQDSAQRRFAPTDNMTSSQPQLQPLGSPAHISPRAPATASQNRSQGQSLGQGNALSHLQPAQVRVLRDGFQIMDRDGDGVVNREDVADMLTQLGTFFFLRHNRSNTLSSIPCTMLFFSTRTAGTGTWQN